MNDDRVGFLFMVASALGVLALLVAVVILL